MAKRTPRQELRANTTRAPYRREKASAVPVSAADGAAVAASAADAKASKSNDVGPPKETSKAEPGDAKGAATPATPAADSQDPKAKADVGPVASDKKTSNSESIESKSESHKAPAPAPVEPPAPPAPATPVAAPAGPTAAELAAVAAAALANTAAVVEPLPTPDALDKRDPDSAAEPPGRAPPGDARSMRDHEGFVLVYRSGAAVVSRRGRLGTYGTWRVVDYPGPAQAAHAYALECSRLTAQGFHDVG
ncbi:MAG: hypothetical protein R3B06_01610 [Kofleriaceae bacterium]